MEFEISDKPDNPVPQDDDVHVITDHYASRDGSSVCPQDYPDLEDRALYIPDEGD